MEMMNEISFCSNNGCSRLRLGEDDIQVKSLGRYVLEQVITTVTTTETLCNVLILKMVIIVRGKT